jgi:hypothetical protein
VESLHPTPTSSSRCTRIGILRVKPEMAGSDNRGWFAETRAQLWVRRRSGYAYQVGDGYELVGSVVGIQLSGGRVSVAREGLCYWLLRWGGLEGSVEVVTSVAGTDAGVFECEAW